jgi:hypothetical protein
MANRHPSLTGQERKFSASNSPLVSGHRRTALLSLNQINARDFHIWYENLERIHGLSSQRDDRILSVRNATYALCGPMHLHRHRRPRLPMFHAAIEWKARNTLTKNWASICARLRRSRCTSPVPGAPAIDAKPKSSALNRCVQSAAP